MNIRKQATVATKAAKYMFLITLRTGEQMTFETYALNQRLAWLNVAAKHGAQATQIQLSS